MTEGGETLYGLPLHVIESLRSVFRQCPQIEKVWLYGSRASGRERAASDIDLCIDAEDLDLSQLLAIENEIDDLLLPWKVDLALRRKIDNPALLDHIRRVGVVFFERKGGNG